MIHLRMASSARAPRQQSTGRQSSRLRTQRRGAARRCLQTIGHCTRGWWKMFWHMVRQVSGSSRRQGSRAWRCIQSSVSTTHRTRSGIYGASSSILQHMSLQHAPCKPCL